MQISKRLEAVAALITPGSTLADIGTDHAYIPIYLAEAGQISGAIAADINRGPLQRAAENIRHYGQERVIETRLSDGLAAFYPGEADCIVIAGMGGPLTVRILSDGRAVAEACRELILQPQSDIRQVREYLENEGWKIMQENMILEDGKFYPMMKAVKAMERGGASGAEEKQSGDIRISEKEGQKPPRVSHEAELRYGPLLILERNPVLLQFLHRERRICRQILQALDGQAKEAAESRRAEVQEELSLIEAVISAMAE